MPDTPETPERDYEEDDRTVFLRRDESHVFLELGRAEWDRLEEVARVKGLYLEGLLIEIIGRWLHDNEHLLSVVEQRKAASRRQREMLELQLREHCDFDEDDCIVVEENLDNLRLLFDLTPLAGPRQILERIRMSGVIYAEGRIWMGIDRGISP